MKTKKNKASLSGAKANEAKPNYTPMPQRNWQVGHIEDSHYYVYSDEGWTMVGTADDSATDKKIAELIVRAVNSHERILKALESTLGVIQAKMDVVKGAEKEWHFIADDLREVIRQARGE